MRRTLMAILAIPCVLAASPVLAAGSSGGSVEVEPDNDADDVPEPGMVGLMAIGCLGLAISHRRRAPIAPQGRVARA